MCGISGIAFSPRSSREVTEAILVRMRDVLQHRGPDDAGLFIEGPIGLAHRRLEHRWPVRRAASGTAVREVETETRDLRIRQRVGDRPANGIRVMDSTKRLQFPGHETLGSNAQAVDAAIQQQIAKGQLDELQKFQSLGDIARLSHPTHDHFLPLLYAAVAGPEQPAE